MASAEADELSAPSGYHLPNALNCLGWKMYRADIVTRAKLSIIFINCRFLVKWLENHRGSDSFKLNTNKAKKKKHSIMGSLLSHNFHMNEYVRIFACNATCNPHYFVKSSASCQKTCIIYMGCTRFRITAILRGKTNFPILSAKFCFTDTNFHDKWNKFDLLNRILFFKISLFLWFSGLKS